MVWGNHTGSQHMDTSRNRRFSCGTISRTTVKIKVLHQNLYILMGTKKNCSDRYCIWQLWWHSVTNGLGEPHGIQTYGYIKKSEELLLSTGITAKIKVLQQTLLVLMPTRTVYGIYGIELHVLWWHSVTIGLGDPHGVPTYGYIKKSEILLWKHIENNC